MTSYPVERWLSESQISSVDYAEYWNDEQQERGKAWNVRDGNFAGMEEYLDHGGLLDEITQCLDVARERFDWSLHGSGADLGSGSLWAVPLLIKDPEVKTVYCVEYSRHRLLDLGPRVLDHYGVPPEKVVLCLGSFYELGLPPNCLDFVLLSQAFHHAEHPRELLREVRRVLSPGGIVMITGEPIFGIRKQTRHVLTYIFARLVPPTIQKKLLGKTVRADRLLPRGQILVDPVLGDHGYAGREYRRMFSEAGYDSYRLPRRSHQTQSFLLRSR